MGKGIEARFQCAGPTEDEPPLVLVHGALSDHRVWEPLIERLAGKVAVIAPTLHGFYPERDLPGDFGARRHVDDLVALIAAIGRPVHLVGHSRGGRLAIHVASRCGDAIRSLVAIEPGGIMEPDFLPFPPSPRPAAIMETACEALAAGEAEKAVRMLIDASDGEGAFDRAPESARRTAIANAHTISGMSGDPAMPLSRSIARAIACPVWLVHGATSPDLFRSIIAVLAEEIRDVRTVGLPGDHFLPADPGSGLAELLIGIARRRDRNFDELAPDGRGTSP